MFLVCVVLTPRVTIKHSILCIHRINKERCYQVMEKAGQRGVFDMVVGIRDIEGFTKTVAKTTY